MSLDVRTAPVSVVRPQTCARLLECKTGQHPPSPLSCEVRTMLGKKRVQAIGLSLDDPHAFADTVELSLKRLDD